MLDLSKLDQITTKKIISIYKDYRKSVIEGNERIELINEIDEILKKEYKYPENKT